MGSRRMRQRLNGRHGALAARAPIATNSSDAGINPGQDLPEERLHLLAPVAAIADTVGDPGDVRLQQQIEIGPTLTRERLEKGGTLAEIVMTVGDGADQIRIAEQQGIPTRTGGGQTGLFQRHLAAGDGAMITEAQRRPFLERIAANEFRDHHHAVVRTQRLRERGFPHRLRTRQDDAGDGGGSVGVVRVSDFVHCTSPRMARPRNTA